MQKIRLVLYNPNLRQIMRKSFMLWTFLLTWGIVFASTESYGQKELLKTIKVDFKNITLQAALEELQTKHQIPLAYNNDAQYLKAKVNYAGKNTAKEILNDILSKHNLIIESKHDFVRIIRKPNTRNTRVSVLQQEVTGTVKGAEGQPLAGVTVFEKDKQTNGTTTDLNGKFILSVPQNATLVFQIVGYKTLEAAIGTNKSIEVTMEATEEGIDEVVVVGFGTRRN